MGRIVELHPRRDSKVGRTVPLTAVFVGNKPRRARFEPVTMGRPEQRPIGKPTGGLWTCPDSPADRLAWVEFCAQIGRDVGRARLWQVSAPNPRVYTIDTLLAFHAALERWPHHRYPEIDPCGLMAEINFEQMAEDGYDAVHLTAAGNRACHLAEPITLNGWDVPTILWLKWCITSVEQTGL